jgi:hypothetical protein
MIIYPYRDAIEGIQEIVSENKQESPEVKRQLANACRDYLDWAGESEDDEDDEGMECIDD